MSLNDFLPISVVVLTKNEAKGIGACLAQLGDFSEVVVSDSNSEDRTREISLGLGARVESFTWNGQFPKKKQWQLDRVAFANDWVLYLDADETPSVQLVAELRRLFKEPVPDTIVAYDIALDYVFAGRVLRFGHRVKKRALVRVGFVKFPEVDDLNIPGMGEVEGHYQPDAFGLIGNLGGRILHNDLDPIASWFSRHNRYSDWEAHLRIRPETRRGVASKRSLQGQIFDRVPFKPVLFFFYSYFFRFGFLDGRAGFDYATALSMYYWQIEVKVRELKRNGGTSNG
jgi:glycosyltransferase involved in cell wall biosynthesis